MKKTFFRVLAVVLLVSMLIATLPIGVLAATITFDTGTDHYNIVVSQKEYAIAPGVTEQAIILNDATGENRNRIHVMQVDPTNQYATVMASYRNQDGNTWGTQVLTEQAASAEEKFGVNVVGGINCNLRFSSNEPVGMLVINGVKYHEELTDYGYLVLTKDGKYEIREGNVPLDGTEQQAVTANMGWLVRNSAAVQNVNDHDPAGRAPRTAMGLKADGTLVLVVNDGRNAPAYVGMTMGELAQTMLDLGCVVAVNCDGGGTSTYISKREGEETYQVRNNPSDGSERPTLGALLVLSTATPSGVFDHASVTPNGDLYTTGAKVLLTATGIDSSGNAADAIPENATWRMASGYETMGEISNETISGNSASALFTPNGALGDAVAELVVDGNVVGTAKFSIVEPDTVSFGSSSASLDFGESSNLGLVVMKDGKNVVYGDEDFEWTVTSMTSGVTSEVFGSVAANIFTAGQGNGTMLGTVSVSYKTLSAQILVEIGKAPFVSFDFEADEDGNVMKAAHYDWGTKKEGHTGYTPTATTIPLYDSTRWTNGNKPYRYITSESYPIVFGGNYHNQSSASVITASDVFNADGYSFYLWPNGAISKYAVGSVRMVNEAQGGKVRFGEYAMEVNYDYASYDGTQNANFYVRYSGDPLQIPGSPKQIGMWVYADEKSQGFGIYTDIGYWNGTNYALVNCKLTPDGDSNSNAINWTGWKYVYADIPDSALKSITDEHPLIIYPGMGVFWISYQPSSSLSTGRYNGTIYVDNIRFVYGSDSDDLVNPEITSITANGVELSTDPTKPTVLDSKTAEIWAYFNDPESANRAGINATATQFLIDGFAVQSDGGDLSARTEQELANGLHSVQVTVYDKFQNATTETRYFRIEDSSLQTATVVLVGDETISMGGKYNLYVMSVGQVDKFSMDILQLNSDFGAPTITFADGWTQSEAEWSETGFKLAKIDISAEYTAEGAVPENAVLATITFEIPGTIDPEIDFFTYYITRVEARPEWNADATHTAAQPKVKLTVDANCTIISEVAISGFNTVLTVRDKAGKPIAGASVYIITGGQADTFVGQTDANGQLVLTKTASTNAGVSLDVQVKNGDYVSYKHTIKIVEATGNADGTPSAVKLTAVGDLSCSFNISWMSNPAVALKNAVIEYVEAALYESGEYTFTRIEGASALNAFYTSNTAGIINTVSVSGLKPGTEYCYRIGDGEDGHWSEIAGFKTSVDDDTTKFIVVGDTQMSGNDTEDADAINLLDKIGTNASDIDFGIQTGDYVDNGGNSIMWSQINAVFSKAFAGTSFIHTMGNHEYYGDAAGDAASMFFALQNRDYYSVQQGDVYVASISLNADLEEALAWLVSDAKSSDAAWKVLTIHQPAYYTNPNGGSARYHELIPAAAEAAGIRFVFSGHDHSYARTQPMINGTVDENGVVYFICGDLGEKSRDVNYAAVNDPEFNFAKIDQSYSALYLECEANWEYITVTAYSVAADGTKTVVDQYTAHNHVCSEHEYVKRANGKMGCKNCTYKGNFAEFSGLFFDEKTGKYYYAMLGTLVSGWKMIGVDYYYFDTISYAAVNGERTFMLDKPVTYVFENNGRLSSGVWHNRRYYYGPGFYWIGWEVIDDETYYFENGYCKTGKGFVIASHSTIAQWYDFGETGALVEMITDTGLFWINENLYYLINGQSQCGMYCIDGDFYYFVTSGRAAVTNGSYYCWNTLDSGITAGTYEFGADGKMINPPAVDADGKLLNGIVTEEGTMYYYVNGVKNYAGLIKIDGDYYYVNSSFKVVTGRYYVWKTNGLLPQKYYTFDVDGKMILDY